MKIIYSNQYTYNVCTNLIEAKKLFGGNVQLALSLLKRVNNIENAVLFVDILRYKTFHFHKLRNLGKYKNLEGFFAIDVKGRTDPWRIIVQPLDKDGNEFIPCNIDEIASSVKIIKILEVSKHYE